MSFDFGDAKPSDPTADFLAREREAAGVLSGDADLFGAGGASSGGNNDFSASAYPALDDDGLPVPAQPSSATGGFGFDDDDDDLLSGPTTAAVAAPSKPVVDDEVGKFQQSFPELDDEPTSNGAYDAANSRAPTSAASTATVPTATQPSYSYAYEEPSEDPPAVVAWRESQRDAIAKRDAEAERKRAEAISKAEQDIDKFYAEYNAKKEKNIATNKEQEATFQDQRSRELADGTTWNRITKLLELQNSQSKTIAKVGPGSSDLSRMKELYLSLRREGETAPGAAGY